MRFYFLMITLKFKKKKFRYFFLEKIFLMIKLVNCYACIELMMPMTAVLS